MEQFKRAQVIMLPTNTKTYIGKFLEDEPYLALYNWYLKSLNIPNQRQGQHLYIISDDEIKEKHLLNTNDYYYIKNHYNEWYIGKFNGISFDFINNNGNFDSNLFVCKKIIATTDSSLKIQDITTKHIGRKVISVEGTSLLPQPSQQFITKYIEEYNKGNIITDVLVEYEVVPNPVYNGSNYFDAHNINIVTKLKINPKDNTITIKKIKDNYSKIEVIELLTKSMKECEEYQLFNHWSGEYRNLNKWIEENL